MKEAMSRVVISLCGRKRSGKESAFRQILPYVRKPKEFQFATPLKKFCIDVLGLSHEQCYGSDMDRESATSYKWSDIATHIRQKYKKDPEEHLTARDVLQIIGTDLMRGQFYKNIWAEGALREAVDSNASTCVYTDTRFINEVEVSRKSEEYPNFIKAIIVRLYRDTGLTDLHPSETSLDPLDLVPQQRKLYPHQPTSHCYQLLEDSGYIKVTDSLWKANTLSAQKPGFDYLLDNNHTIDILKENMIYILKDNLIYIEPTLS